MRRTASLLLVLLAAGCAGESEERRSAGGEPGGPSETTTIGPADTAETSTGVAPGTTTRVDPAPPSDSGEGGPSAPGETGAESPPQPEPLPPTPPPSTPPAQPDPGRLAQTRLFVGFHDDPSFRWSRDRGAMLARARAAGASVVRTTIEWAEVQPERPRRAGDPFDPSLRLDGIDELVRRAQRLGIEVLLTIWGTPAWANGDQGRNRVPDDLGDLEGFARALADRYSGRHAGYPFVRFYSVWNEPNLEQFLAPQFDAQGESVSPWLYHRLFRAAYAGLKAGSPNALVAAGETSPRGRDVPSRDKIQDSHSPAGFAAKVSRLRPRLQFDAWAHHPYPRGPRAGPLTATPWPNVRLANLKRFETALDTWFGRRAIPIWLTEYAHETRPGDAKGVDAATQARFAREAIAAAAADPRVRLFVWFTFRDDEGNPWQSGLLNARSKAKPSFAAYRRAARPFDARVAVRHGGGPEAVIRVSALELAYYAGAGAPVGVTARIVGPGVDVLRQPRVKLGRDGWITVRLPVEPETGETYRVQVEAGDEHGHTVTRVATVRAVG